MNSRAHGAVINLARKVFDFHTQTKYCIVCLLLLFFVVFVVVVVVVFLNAPPRLKFH